MLAYNTDELERAVRLLGATADWHVGWHHTRCQEAIAAARQAFGEVAFKTGWEEGAAMTLEEAMDYALGDEKISS
jgi:hypothetical protein